MVFVCPKGLLSVRFVIAMMLFTSCFVTYKIRVNMSINLLAMVEPAKSSGSIAEPECDINRQKENTNSSHQIKQTSVPDYGSRYEWDFNIQGLILGSYFWGYTLTCIPGGVLAEKFGPTKTVMIATLLCGLLTLLGPILSSWHYMALILSRFLIGAFGGVVYPCFHCLISRWAPPEEKGKFIGSLLAGGSLGTVTTWPFLGTVIENLGWTWSFYISGGIVLIWCIFWIVLVSDSPEVHSRISEEEKLYISKSLADTVTVTKSLPPYKDIFLSIPFWALVLLYFGNAWGLHFLMTQSPNFMSTVLGFNLGHTGILATLPHLARLVFGLMFGQIGDLLRKRKIVATIMVRKGFVLFSHIIPGALLLVLNLSGCDLIWTIALLTLSLGSNGASTLTSLQNHQDLAPNFAGSLYGIMNSIGSTAGFITPVVVAKITAEKNGIHEWHIIFCIGALVYIVSGLIFCLFGSADIQSWNAQEDKENIDKRGVQNLAFDNTCDITVKVEDTTDEITKI